MLDITQLRLIRKKLGLTQSQFAKESGVSQSLIAKIESGRLDPSYSNALRIEETINRLHNESEPSVAKIMVKHVITVTPDEPVRAVVKLMTKKGISQVPVMHRNAVVGLVSERAMLEHLSEAVDRSAKVRDIMEECPPIVAPKAPMSVVADLLKYYPVVLVKEGALLGLVTKADLLKAMVR